jgi:hypothetical protein
VSATEYCAIAISPPLTEPGDAESSAMFALLLESEKTRK